MSADLTQLKADFETLRGDFDNMFGEIRGLLKEQQEEIKTYGKSTEETGKKISENHKKWDKLEEDQTSLKQRLDEIEKKSLRGSAGFGGAPAAERKTIGQIFCESDAFKSFVETGAKHSHKVKVDESSVEDQILIAKARVTQLMRKADPLTSAEIGGLVDHFRWDLVQEIRKRPVVITDLLPSMNVDKDRVNHPVETSATELQSRLEGALAPAATSAVLREEEGGVGGMFVGQTLTLSRDLAAEEDIVVLTVTPATRTITFAAVTNAHLDNAEVTGTRFGFTPEGQQKPGGTFTIEDVDTLIQEIATIIGISTRMLEDSALSRQFIDMKLPARLARSIEWMLLYGAQGDARQLPGILTTPGIQTITQVGTKLDVLRRAVTRLNLAFFAATGVVLNPLDWEDIELLQGTDDHYVLWQAPYMSNEPASVWRVPVVTTPVINELQFLMGDWDSGAMIFNRRNTTLNMAREHKDWFERNLVAVRAERRLGFRVLQPDAWVDGTFI